VEKPRARHRREEVSKIEVVLLDLGNVLLEFSHQPIGEALARHASVSAFQNPQEVIRYLFKGNAPAEDPFDEGRVTPLQFYQGVRRQMGLQISFGEFVGIWNSIFREKPGAGAVVRFLKGKVGLHLLSNTNLLHFEHCLREFPWLGEFDSWFLSYELGRKKPHPEVYHRVLERLGCGASQVVYLDDIKDNLLPAAELGIRTVQVSADSSLRGLLGACLPHLPWGELP
jgi:FMN phosphatase YigB (HAD superfamily)